MDEQEASTVLAEWLAPIRAEPYDVLVARIGRSPLTAEIVRGTRTYQLEAECHWDGQPGGNVRVVAAIDDGGLRAFVPLTSDFIKSSTGQFVGE
jgi:phosphohistidine phosphatase SixA